ncbi:MAG: EamA family transporter [Candidatus Omnitrophica bacterium]|nr:EamA family transporter [Candidatus Omnitrophota bacterium]
MLKGKITAKLFAFLVFTDVLETFIHFCFKRGATSHGVHQVNALPDLFFFLQGVFLSPYIWIGLLSVAVAFTLWSTILSKIDLSVAVPVCSFSYIFVPIASIIFLHEKISLLRWGGILMILIGVILVSLTSKDKESLL